MKRSKYRLRIPDDVASMIRKSHPHLKKKIKASLADIIKEPSSGKLLKDELNGLRSYSVSRFRVICRISKKRQIDIIAIGPRKHIYEETYRAIKRGKK